LKCYETPSHTSFDDSEGLLPIYIPVITAWQRKIMNVVMSLKLFSDKKKGKLMKNNGGWLYN
jgi:hypothetical protein